MHTINEILFRLDEIIEECRISQSRVGYFEILYRQVTRRMKEGILRGEFQDNPRMEKLDVLFAKRFIDAYELWRGGQKPTQSWFLAFEASKNTIYLVL